MYGNYYFHTPEEYEQEQDKRLICAWALSEWGHCHTGAKPPEYFGMSMVIVGERLGIIATGDNLMAYAKTIK